MMNIYQSVAAIMSEGYAITKDKRNQQQGFNYRGIDDVMNTFQPLMAKHKVFCVPTVKSQTREERQTSRGGNLIYSVLHMDYTFYAEDGSHIVASVIGEGMDSGDKASNKAMAVAMKYAMFQTFCIPTEEMAAADPDATTPPQNAPKREAKKTQPKAEKPADAATEPQPDRNAHKKIVCATCEKEIPIYADAHNKQIKPERWAQRSEERFGRVLCSECIAALKV